MNQFLRFVFCTTVMLCCWPLTQVQAQDCNGTSYDPDAQGCCSGIIYDLGTQECCSDGTVAQIGQCPPPGDCNGTAYDPNSQGCCNGQVYSLSSEECCSNGTVAPMGQCYQPPLCNGVPFDSNYEECCDGEIVPIGLCASDCEEMQIPTGEETEEVPGSDFVHVGCMGMIVTDSIHCPDSATAEWMVDCLGKRFQRYYYISQIHSAKAGRDVSAVIPRKNHCWTTIRGNSKIPSESFHPMLAGFGIAEN